MTQLLAIREVIKNFIGKFESYVKPASKFLLCFITLLLINGNVGFASRLGNGAIAAIVSLMASFLPLNFILIISAVFILLHLYSLSLAAVIVAGIFMLLMFLVYFRFSPKDTILLLLTPLCFVLKIPYAVPLVAGLVGTPAAVVSVGCGVLIYYMLDFFRANADALAVTETSQILEKFNLIIDGLVINNKAMFVVAAAFAVTIIVVFIIRRLPVDHAWTIAIVTGTLSNIFVTLVGDLKFGTYISVPGLIIGTIIGVLVSIVIKFFLFNVDYSKTERVQFEDDEYVYYVKAVPKNNITIRKPSGEKEKTAGRKVQPSKLQSGNSRRVEIPDDYGDEDIKNYHSRRNGVSSIERAAADKARRARQSRPKQ